MERKTEQQNGAAAAAEKKIVVQVENMSEVNKYTYTMYTHTPIECLCV